MKDSSPKTSIGSTKRVFFTNKHGGLGGGEIALLQHIDSCVRLGYETHLIVLEDGPFLELARKKGCLVHLLPFFWQGNKFRSLWLMVSIIKQVFALYRLYKPNIVFCYMHDDLIFCGIPAKISGIPIVWRSQGEVFTDKHTFGDSWLGRMLIPVIRLLGPKIAATTSADIQRMKNAGLSLPEMQVIFLGAIKQDCIPLVTQVKKPIRIGIFGRLTEWKGQRIFIQSMAALQKFGCDFEAIVVGGASFGGGDEYLASLKLLAEELEVNDRVHFLGHRDDVFELMSSCYAICHCSSFEPFGMVIIESMMAARPVIASDLPGPRESIVDPEVGFLVAYGDYVKIAELLYKLIKNPMIATRMGAAARERAEQLFDLEKNLARLNSYIG